MVGIGWIEIVILGGLGLTLIFAVVAAFVLLKKNKVNTD
jgi:hypothetical protein